jgi:hypothetical protein
VLTGRLDQERTREDTGRKRCDDNAEEHNTIGEAIDLKR